MDTLLRDLKFALRSLRKTPGFTLTAVLTLGLGLGASVAVFSVVNAIYFAPLAFPQMDRLVMIETSRVPSLCRPNCPAMVKPAEVAEFRPQLTSVEGIAGTSWIAGTILTPSGPVRVELAVVSPVAFDLLGLRPIIGRPLVATDDQLGVEDVAVLSHKFWVAQYGGDSAVLNRLLVVDKIPYRIVGVMPPSADIRPPLFSGDTSKPAFFIPPAPAAARDTSLSFVSLLARLKPRASPQFLRAQLDATVAPPDSEMVRDARRWGPSLTWKTRVTRLRTVYAMAYASSYPLFLGAVLLVVVIVCANIAGLFLARCATRRQEIAVRAALGASRARLVRPLLTEGLVIAAGALSLAFLVAYWMLPFTRLLPAGALPDWTAVRIDPRAAAFAIALAGICGVAFTLFPALAVTGDRGSLAIRDSSRTVAGGHAVTAMRRILVTGEIACTLVLLTGAGLVVRLFAHAATRDIGRWSHSFIVGDISDRDGENVVWTSARRRALAEAILNRLKGLPGVAAVAVLGSPADTSARVLGIGAERRPASPEGLAIYAVTPDFFTIEGLKLRNGRLFTDSDRAGGMPVGIITEEVARQLFGERPALGQRLRLGYLALPDQLVTIVGVLASSPCAPPMICDSPDRDLYLPIAQAGLRPDAGLAFDVQARGSNKAMLPIIRAAVGSIDPGIVISPLESTESFLASALAPMRVNAAILGAFALFAAMLAAIGTYGLLAYLVTQRTPEIGIRVALGATPRDVRWLIFRSVAFMTLAGIALGGGASLALTRLLRSMLYGTSPTDPLVFFVAALTLAATASLAGYLPARRATRVDPMTVLRAE